MLVIARRLLALAVSGLALAPMFAAAALPVPLFYQEQGYWCWAASDQMIRSYYGTPISQCSDAQLAVDAGMCGLPGPDCCSNPASCNSSCSSLLQSSPLSYVYTRGPMNWAAVTNEINNGWPFILAWNWDTGGTHMRVVKGYFRSAGINWMQANDPIYGDIYFSQGTYNAHANSQWRTILW